MNQIIQDLTRFPVLTQISLQHHSKKNSSCGNERDKNQTISIMSSSVQCQQEENFTHFSNYHFNLRTKYRIKKLGALRSLFVKKELSAKN